MNYGSVCSGIEAGSQHGKLTAIEVAGRTKDKHLKWKCRCECGNECEVSSNSLKSGITKSCGCLRAIASKKRIQRDGVWNDGKSYSIHGGDRCYKTRNAWAKAVIRHYGNKCEICDWSEARCDAHHRKPKSKGGLHTIRNGQVLCPNHHRLVAESK